MKFSLSKRYEIITDSNQPGQEIKMFKSINPSSVTHFGDWVVYNYYFSRPTEGLKQFKCNNQKDTHINFE